MLTFEFILFCNLIYPICLLDYFFFNLIYFQKEIWTLIFAKNLKMVRCSFLSQDQQIRANHEEKIVLRGVFWDVRLSVKERGWVFQTSSHNFNISETWTKLDSIQALKTSSQLNFRLDSSPKNLKLFGADLILNISDLLKRRSSFNGYIFLIIHKVSLKIVNLLSFFLLNRPAILYNSGLTCNTPLFQILQIFQSLSLFEFWPCLKIFILA